MALNISRRRPRSVGASGPLSNARWQSLLDVLRYRARATVSAVAGDLGLNVETARGHLRTLETRKLVRRDGTLKHGRGRPEVAYVLTEDGEAHFPSHDGDVLRALGKFLVARGQVPLLGAFYREYLAPRRAESLSRVAALTGKKRAREVARIFAEWGFMPVIEEAGGALRLRLSHCPVRNLVRATQAPCRAEMGLLRDLLGGPVKRIEHAPHGGLVCSYLLPRTVTGGRLASTSHVPAISQEQPFNVRTTHPRRASHPAAREAPCHLPDLRRTRAR